MRLLTKLYIKDKEGKKVRYKPKRAQLHYHNHRTGKDIILKARQIGFSTHEQLRKLEKLILTEGISSATIAHKKDKALDIFRIAKFAWDNLPEEFRAIYKVKFDNVREILLGATNSRYYVDTDIRSGTVQDLHISEIAFISELDRVLAGALEAVPKGGSITFETTANGLNTFSDLWNDAVQGKNEFTPHFYNWTWDDGYTEVAPGTDAWKEDYKTLAKKYELIADIQNRLQISDEQFYWYYLKARRQKELVKQEYPCIPEEAFLSSSISVFDLYKVQQLVARQSINAERGALVFEQPILEADYIIGCDTSEGVGGDSSTFEVVRVDGDRIVNVASFRDGTIRPDQLADLLIWFGMKYNKAFIIPERNSSGLTTVLRLQEKNYPRLYVSKSFDKKSQRQLNEYGWRTTSSSRDVMIDDFIERFEEGKVDINSPYIIQEMKTFVRKENGKREHDEGYHDDSLFAMFLANQGVKFHRSTMVELQNADYFGL